MSVNVHIDKQVNKLNISIFSVHFSGIFFLHFYDWINY